MSAPVCPYCRGTIDAAVEAQRLCPGCGTPHHSDCFEENCGCTVFGCSAAPAEEPKLSFSATDFATPQPRVATPLTTTLHLEPSAPALALQSASPTLPAKVKAPPPPMPDSVPVASVAAPLPAPRYGSGSILFGVQPVAAVAVSTPASDFDFDLEESPGEKNRTTYIVLGVLLGIFGAHNFYAGFQKKAWTQLAITLLSLGFAGPMIWVWAVIDVCTIFRDSKGIKFRT
jgi:hypothetical protein